MESDASNELIQIGRRTSAAPVPRRGDVRPSNLPMLLQVASAALDRYRPLLAQIVISRRCNLSCGYCYEYDKVSQPVPTETLLKRFDDLKRLRTVFVTLNGGEPLIHPEVPRLVEGIRARKMTPLMNSNGFLLTRPLVLALNQAGLYGMQISVDNVLPNSVTQKSLKTLMPKLEILQAHAQFRVRVNSVLGSSNADEAVEVARTVSAMGFDAQCSLMRDAHGHVLPLSDDAQRAYLAIRSLSGRLPAYLHDDFQLPLARGETIEWKCRSGARYFHVDESGLVHLCQPRAGNPGKPLSEYTVDDVKRAFHMRKECSTRCPHAYAHIGSRMDQWRSQSNPMTHLGQP